MEKVIPYTGITISRLIFALIVLIAGFLLARYVTHIFKNAIRKTNIPDLTIQFLPVY